MIQKSTPFSNLSPVILFPVIGYTRISHEFFVFKTFGISIQVQWNLGSRVTWFASVPQDNQKF